MEVNPLQGKLESFIKKYKYVALILVIGIGLMLLPEKSEKTEPTPVTENIVTQKSIEEQLSDILSDVDGAGKVKILLTIRAGEETLFQTNSSISNGSDTSSTQITTVTITSSDKNEYGLIRQINPPTYMGAIIVCEGADSPSVRLAVIEAVSKVTGLGSDKISVLKMK